MWSKSHRPQSHGISGALGGGELESDPVRSSMYNVGPKHRSSPRLSITIFGNVKSQRTLGMFYYQVSHVHRFNCLWGRPLAVAPLDVILYIRRQPFHHVSQRLACATAVIIYLKSLSISYAPERRPGPPYAVQRRVRVRVPPDPIKRGSGAHRIHSALLRLPMDEWHEVSSRTNSSRDICTVQ